MGVVAGDQFAWTEQAIVSLKGLWSSGLSASRIATQLGGGLSRSAVIGKVHRPGLSARAKSPSEAKRTHVKSPVKHVRVSMGPIVRARASTIEDQPRPEPVRTPAALEAFNAAVPIEQRRTLLQLEHGLCKWPCGDPQNSDFFFCGSPWSGPTPPYCSTHRFYGTEKAPRRQSARSGAD